MGPQALLLLAAGAIALAVFAFRRFGGATAGALFVFTVEARGVRLEGTVPGKSDADARDFIERMELPVGAKLWGHRSGEGVRLRFSSDVPDDLQQRARNYFGT
ncbi:MAG: DUF3634 family protein [Nannocystaceae bacterium]|nr:DUF3634 family protein [bacterium]